MSLFLNHGERGLLVGQTGSGKTQNALFQLRNAKTFPIIIFDTKIEDAFFAAPLENEKMELVESVEQFLALSKRPRNKMPDFILVRPNVSEIMNLDILDMYGQIAYDCFGSCFIYVDELYQWHTPGGTPVKSIIALYTRGRSKGKTFLGSSQRPARISRFCVSESQKFYVHWLGDNRDRKILNEVIPNFDKMPPPPKHHFYHFEAGEHLTPVLYKPVPFTKLNPEKIFTKMWI